MKIICLVMLLMSLAVLPVHAQTESVEGAELGANAVFDDRALINGYIDKFSGEDKSVLLAMINDDSIGAYKTAAAVRVFKQKYGSQILSDEKPSVIRLLLRKLSRIDSPFAQVEIFHSLIVLDRYQYFESMMPRLIQKLDHYNEVVRTLSYENIEDIIQDNDRTREARIVFTTLRKMFFLSRNRLNNVQVINEQLKRKIKLLRWAIKVLGTQELKRLPSEVIRLL